MRKVIVRVSVSLVINMDEYADVADVINEMDYTFTDQTGKAEVEDSDILDYDVVDSK
jgi:hypothetical protein